MTDAVPGGNREGKKKERGRRKVSFSRRLRGRIVDLGVFDTSRPHHGLILGGVKKKEEKKEKGDRRAGERSSARGRLGRQPVDHAADFSP